MAPSLALVPVLDAEAEAPEAPEAVLARLDAPKFEKGTLVDLCDVVDDSVFAVLGQVAGPDGTRVTLRAGDADVDVVVPGHSLDDDGPFANVSANGAKTGVLLWSARCVVACALDSRTCVTVCRGRVRQAAWHPLSDVHVGVLTCNHWRLINLATSPNLPEVELQLDDYADFCFCRRGSLWAHLAVFFVTRDGSVRFRTPVLPRHAILPNHAVTQIVQTRGESFAAEMCRDESPEELLAWLAETFWHPETRFDPAGRSVRVRHLGARVPAEQTLLAPPLPCSAVHVLAHDPLVVIARAGEQLDVLALGEPLTPGFAAAELEATVFETVELGPGAKRCRDAAASGEFLLRAPGATLLLSLPWLKCVNDAGSLPAVCDTLHAGPLVGILPGAGLGVTPDKEVVTLPLSKALEEKEPRRVAPLLAPCDVSALTLKLEATAAALEAARRGGLAEVGAKLQVPALLYAELSASAAQLAAAAGEVQADCTASLRLAQQLAAKQRQVEDRHEDLEAWFGRVQQSLDEQVLGAKLSQFQVHVLPRLFERLAALQHQVQLQQQGRDRAVLETQSEENGKKLAQVQELVEEVLEAVRRREA